MGMKSKCRKCIHGSINFWGYRECWKDNKEPDLTTTIHTANREHDAQCYNKHNDCIHYIRNNFINRLFHKESDNE